MIQKLETGELLNSLSALAAPDGPLSKEFVDQAVVTIQALASQSTGWRPIEEAPKDGTEILAAWRASQTVSVAWWTDSGWWDGESEGVFISSPTHWMPIPSPPQS